MATGSYILGDFNMIELEEDFFGPSPPLGGRRLESWQLLITRLDLTDAFLISIKFIGTQFTQRSAHGTRLDQSHLDRFYMSASAY